MSTLEVQEHEREGRDPDQVVQDSAAVGVVRAVVVGLHIAEHLAHLLRRGSGGVASSGWEGQTQVGGWGLTW